MIYLIYPQIDHLAVPPPAVVRGYCVGSARIVQVLTQETCAVYRSCRMHGSHQTTWWVGPCKIVGIGVSSMKRSYRESGETMVDVWRRRCGNKIFFQIVCFCFHAVVIDHNQQPNGILDDDVFFFLFRVRGKGFLRRSPVRGTFTFFCPSVPAVLAGGKKSKQHIYT